MISAIFPGTARILHATTVEVDVVVGLLMFTLVRYAQKIASKIAEHMHDCTRPTA